MQLISKKYLIFRINVTVITSRDSMTPQLNRNMSAEEFDEYYFLKQQLVDFCREEGLKISGNKSDLEERIRYYLNTGKKLDNTKKHTYNVHDNITLNTTLGENFVCSQEVRAFFEDKIGSKFKFKVSFQKWLKNNPDKTFADAIIAYDNILSENNKKDIGKQFKYNQYIRDFFKNNPDKTFDDAVKCWNYRKKMRGTCKYDDSDLKILNEANNQ